VPGAARRRVRSLPRAAFAVLKGLVVLARFTSEPVAEGLIALDRSRV
jgi:hypothetical protein